MENTKKEVNKQEIEVKTSKSYWVVTASALIVYFIAFANLESFSLPNALGVLIGGFVISRLIEYIYSLVSKDKNHIRRKLIQSLLFLVWAIIYLLMTSN